MSVATATAARTAASTGRMIGVHATTNGASFIHGVSGVGGSAGRVGIIGSIGNTGSRRSFAKGGGGGFHGPTSRGMGRDGGGRGPGGPHRSPRGGRGGRGDGASTGGGSFAELSAKRAAAIEKDLEAARKATANAASSAATGPSAVPPPGSRQARPHKYTKHAPHTYSPPGDETHHRPGRTSHKGGPPKVNVAETFLRSDEEDAGGSPTGAPPSAIPKLLARRRVGHQIHDEEGLATANPRGTRRSGRASVKGEMRGSVMGDLEAEEMERAERRAMRMERMDRGERVPERGARIGQIGSALRERLSYVQNRPPGPGGPGRGGGGRGPPGSQAGRLPARRSAPPTSKSGYSKHDDEDDDEDEENFMDYWLIANRYLSPYHYFAPESQFSLYPDGKFGELRRDGGLRGGFPVGKELNPDHVDVDDGYDSDWDEEPPTYDDRLVDDDDDDEFEFPLLPCDDPKERLEIMKELDEEEEEENIDAGDDGEYKDPNEDTFEHDYLVRDVTDFDNYFNVAPSKPISNAVLPLRAHGPELGDFLEATADHPSAYSQIERKFVHPDSRRQPKPLRPKKKGPNLGRVMPSKLFVEKYKGYLYVTGLVPQVDKEGELLKWEDPLHQQTMSENVAELFDGVSSLNVVPASYSSAFIGFDTKMEAKKAMIQCVQKGNAFAVEHPTKLELYDANEKPHFRKEKRFVSASSAGAESILKITGLPVEATSVEILQSLFPPGTKLEAMFGPLSHEDYLRISPTTALIRLSAPDLVVKALKSTNLSNNAAFIGKRPLQVVRAKRERVFDEWCGPNRCFGSEKLGARLLVHGDVPPQEMFLSHHNTLKVTGLPPSVTLKDLATFFQPFSADPRDVLGSGHIVRCARGIPTGTAYVGFELPGEINQVMDLYKKENNIATAVIGNAEVMLQVVHDKGLRRGKRESARTARPLEELERDLNDWERHVDPKDIAELESLGVEKSVLGEVFLTLRHHNRTFAALDQAAPAERLHQDRQIGMHYREVVRRYIKILKECMGTEENPGLLYEAMFEHGQPVDMGLFDIERNRIKELRQKGI